MSGTTRVAISKKTRFEVFKRDGFCCQYCGATPPKVILQVDHINPVKEGGKNNLENLITSCQDCNLGKGATPLECIPQSLSDKALEVAEREEQLRGYTEVLQHRANRVEEQAWQVVRELEADPNLNTYNRQRLLSIKRFVERMPVTMVIEAADTTRAKFSRIGDGAFRYFCGICWSKLREMS